MSNDRTPILFPVGRMVAGDLYKPNEKDADGNPLLVKNGPNKGQPRVEYYLAVAIPKNGRPWWETEWGSIIFQAGAAAFPQACQQPTFAWKIKDGDDAQPRQGKGGKPGKPYNQREGWAGHWIVSISSGYAPKIVSADGSSEITEPGAVKTGYYVQVFGNVSGNGSNQRPGIHINHNGIALAGYGPEIATGVDLSAVGFGGALPAGASPVPVAGMTAIPPGAGVPSMPGAPAGAMPGMPGVPAGPAAGPVGFPGGYPQPGAPVAGVPTMPAAGVPTMPAAGVPVAGVPGVPAGVPQIAGVAPNPAFLSVPGAPGVPVAPVAPVAPQPPARRLTAAAGGATYEQLIGAGWTDQTLVQHGLMLA